MCVTGRTVCQFVEGSTAVKRNVGDRVWKGGVPTDGGGGGCQGGVPGGGELDLLW